MRRIPLFHLKVKTGQRLQALHRFAKTPDVAQKLVLGTWDESDRLDEEIARAAENWRMDRMATVDRNVLRVATWEMLFDHETPPAVIIDEAIEIARKFGSEDSGAFINGILDSIKNRMLRGST